MCKRMARKHPLLEEQAILLISVSMHPRFFAFDQKLQSNSQGKIISSPGPIHMT